MPKHRKTVWIKRGWQPHHIGFCPSRSAWKSTVKKLGQKGMPYPIDVNPHADAFCSTFAASKSATHCSIITINKRMDKDYSGKHRINALGVIVHEVMHAYQDTIDSMGEKKPGIEFEAYSVQAIFVQILALYTKQRIKWKPKRNGQKENS